MFVDLWLDNVVTQNGDVFFMDRTMNQKKMTNSLGRYLSTFALTVGLIGTCSAESFPTKPIRLLVPSPGATEVICRQLADKMQVSLGQSVIVETKPGAGTTVASNYVANAAPDGYTLLCVISAFLTAPYYFTESRYQPLKDFAPVALVVKVAHVLLIRDDLPIKSIKELIQYAQANPNKLTFGSSGVGTSNYLGAALFQNMAKVRMTNVPYKGGAPALQDLVGGRIDLLFDVPQAGVAFVQSGRLRALGITTDARLKAFPDWPTIAEAGVPGYASFPWAGVIAPAKTPDAVVKRLNQSINDALRAPDLIERFTGMGLNIAGGTPESFRDFMASESKKWNPIIENLQKQGL